MKPAPERFELLDQIGKGGMGTVWKARDTETGEVVALKLLHEMYAADPDYVARFEREVDVALRIHSPHVVQVHGYGRHRGQPYVAMELVEGESLKDLIRRKGKLTWDETRDLAAQITSGLSAAHAAGVIHRDVKPSNILVTPDGQAKLADFGIARALDMTRLTRGVTTMGTPHYMAPDAETTEASDVYSLGCVMYEMLTGAPPFDGEGTAQVLLGHLRDEPDILRLPPEARAGCLRRSRANGQHFLACVRALMSARSPRSDRTRPTEASRRTRRHDRRRYVVGPTMTCSG